MDSVPLEGRRSAPTDIDAYITPLSMAKLGALYPNELKTVIVIGCGYGEIVAMFASHDPPG